MSQIFENVFCQMQVLLLEPSSTHRLYEQRAAVVNRAFLRKFPLRVYRLESHWRDMIKRRQMTMNKINIDFSLQGVLKN